MFRPRRLLFSIFIILAYAQLLSEVHLCLRAVCPHKTITMLLISWRRYISVSSQEKADKRLKLFRQVRGNLLFCSQIKRTYI